MRRAAILATILGTACAGATQAPHTDAAPRIGDEWFAARAAALGVELEQAKARDAALAENAPPERIDDPMLMDEAARLWSNLCAKCHGEDGIPPENIELKTRPKKWTGMGPAMGFFFGGDSMRAGIYRRISEGGELKDSQPSEMPAWRDTLAREQIWALVRHIEAF